MIGKQKIDNKALFYNIKTAIRLPVLVVCLFALSITIHSRPAYAPCLGCLPGDANGAAELIKQFHKGSEEAMKLHISSEYTAHRKWMTSTFFEEHFLKALMMFI